MLAWCSAVLHSIAVNFGELSLNSRAGPSPPHSASSTVTTAPPFPISDVVPNRYDTRAYGRPGFLTGPAIVSSERGGGLTGVATAPGSLALGPAFADTGSTTIPTIHGSMSIQSMPVVPRRRGQFQLPCSPHSPQPQRTPDRYETTPMYYKRHRKILLTCEVVLDLLLVFNCSAEIEQKYQEIMKQNGMLALQGQVRVCDGL